MRRYKGKQPSQTVHVAGIDLPIRIYLENRNNSRVSLGKKAIHIRLPFWLSRQEKKIQIRKFLEWARDKLIEKAGHANKEKQRRYRDGDKLQVGSDIYFLRIDYKNRKTGSARLMGKDIHVALPERLTQEEQNDIISTLISRSLAAHYLPWISKKIQNLNQLYFNRPINRVTFSSTPSGV